MGYGSGIREPQETGSVKFLECHPAPVNPSRGTNDGHLYYVSTMRVGERFVENVEENVSGYCCKGCLCVNKSGHMGRVIFGA